MQHHYSKTSRTLLHCRSGVGSLSSFAVSAQSMPTETADALFGQGHAFGQLARGATTRRPLRRRVRTACYLSYYRGGTGRAGTGRAGTARGGTARFDNGACSDCSDGGACRAGSGLSPPLSASLRSGSSRVDLLC
jgi:hypothetical protein